MPKLLNRIKRRWYIWRLDRATKANAKACALLDYWQIEADFSFDGIEIIDAEDQVGYWKIKRAKSFDRMLFIQAKLNTLETK